MSANISLGDTPGVSAYFDGQPIQDELEAEIRREEERQEKELRNLLATELEDFEEDFLSDSNSEDDSVNVSRVSRASSHNHRVRQDEQSTVLQASGKVTQLVPDAAGANQRSDQEVAKDAYFSPVSQRHHPGLQKSEGLLHKHQQNLLLQQQQQQQSHHPHQQLDPHAYHQHRQDVNQNHQAQFVPSSQYDSISQGHEASKNNAFPSYDQDGDDWMMKVQQTHAVTASSSSPYQQSSHHHHHHHPHQQHQQHHPHHQQQQQQQFYTPHSVPKNAGVAENPPLPIPNHLRNVQQHQQQQAFPSPIVKSPSSQPSTPKAIHMETSTPILSTAPVMASADSRQKAADNMDDYDNYQVKYKSKPSRNDINENDFYIQNENVEFFRAEGGEEKRSYQQLEVLYRARGRELEDLTWKLKQAEEDAAKEGRMYKHKLALATGDVEGGQDSLRQCQSLLQQSKSDLTESQALVRSLETQVASLKEAKEELIKKLQVAESTIENLSHQCEELQQSESLSRARNEHENVVASLTQRFDRELLSVKEKLDETRSNLESKHDETVWLKKQLADSTKELEQAQISRGETINRLAKSLEDSQRQCQTLLEQSSVQEMASLKVKLQQTIASKSVSEETCVGLQSEIQELKEQLSMFESASALGAVSSSSIGVGASLGKMAVGKGQGLDDSMTDLGIKKTLDFDTPNSTPKLADTSSLEELITSLRSELEKCLYSNRQKRAEIAEKGGEIQSLKQELKLSQSKGQDLEKTCSEQQMRLKDLDLLMSTKNGESIVEVRLRRDIDALSKEKAILLEDIEDYKKRIEEVGASEAKLTEINTELSAQIGQMVSDFDSDKASALDRCQRTLEEVHHMTINNVRSELESRLASEKGMMAECHRMELDRVNEQLNSAQEEAHSVKSLYIQACDDMKKQEEETRAQIKKEVEEELASVLRCKDEAKETAKVQEEKERRLCVEENFAKEKDSWNERQELYEKEIQASKHIIAEIKSSHEKDNAGLQETISTLKSHHKEEMNALDDRLANLVSSHQSEIQKMKEESGKIDEMKIHFEGKLELAEKLYRTEKEELENQLQVERKSKLVENSIMTKSGNDVSVLTSCVETKDMSMQVDNAHSGEDGDAERFLRERLLQAQTELDSAKEDYLATLEKLRNEHKKEFEKAAKNREEKFQVELRYFLKNKDDKFKEKLDLALKKCQEDSKADREKYVKEKETEMGDLKKELESIHLTLADIKARAASNQEDKTVANVVEKMNAEKLVMQKKIDELELEKKKELSSLTEKYANEEKDLVEKYNNDIKVLTLKHNKECAELHRRIKDLEISLNTSPEDDNANDKEDVKKVVSARIREERARWFKDAQEYIRKEIESGIAERDQHNGDDTWSRKLNEEVKRNVEMELDRMKHKMEVEIEEEVDQRLSEQLAKEMKKLRLEGEKKEREGKKTIDTQVKQKLSAEIENLKIKFLSELEARVGKEKDQLEQDVKKWKEEMKKKIDGDKEVFVAQMNREMGTKLSEERRKVEAEMMQSKQEELKQMRNEMEDEMRKRIQRERMDWKKEEEEWKQQMIEGGGGRAEDVGSASAVRDRLRSAEEACNKAYMERERAVELLKRRDASYKEDKQKLVAGLKQLRHDLNATKEEQVVLEEKYAQMDRKYKEDMKEAKKKKELALEKLQAKCDEEKEKLIVDYKTCIASMNEDFCSEIDRVKSEAEMERAAVLMEVRSHTERALNLSPLQEPDTETTTLFELRDHYLETVTKIKEDVMTHVQAANSRAATTMKSEMRKQRRRLIQVFKGRCKASIRSILNGQVPPNVLNSLDHAIDLIAEAMVTTPKSATSTNSVNSPSNNALAQEKRAHHENKRMDQTMMLGERHQGLATRPGRGDKDDNDLRETGKSKNPLLSSGDDGNCNRNNQQRSHPTKNHPQLSKVDLYDSEAVDSSPQTSHNSSPASITLRTRAIIHSSNKTISSPPIPRLDLSPFHTPKEVEHSPYDSDEQQRQQQQGYLNKAKQIQTRPRSAESNTKTPHYQDSNLESRQKMSKSKPNIDDSGMARNKDEPSPRDRMKMIEAQVRLANWAASGEMPWKGRGSKEGVEKRKGSDLEQHEENLFVRPGKEAEMFLNAQRSVKKRDGELVTPMKKDRVERKAVSQSQQYEGTTNHQKGLAELDGYTTDDSNVSNGSHSSFVTLQPDGNKRSQLTGIQGPKGKDWAMYTTDYDRIKSAVFQYPDKTFVNVTQRRTPGTTTGMGLSSDDDAKSIDSDDVPQYKGLPTSTPAKRTGENHEHYTRSMPEKQKSKFSSTKNWMEDGGGDREHQEPMGWKTVNAFSEHSATRNVDAEHRQGKQRSYSQPRPSKSQSLKQNPRDMGVTKSIDFEFTDISEITHASEDVHVGGGMWRYKSLEDLLPHQAAKMRGNPTEDGNNRVVYNSKKMSVARTAPPPIQAMNSDFWQEQSLDDDDDEDDNDYGRRANPTHHIGIRDDRDDEQFSANPHTHHHHLPVRHKPQSPSNFNTNSSNDDHDYNNHDPRFVHSRQGYPHSNSRQANFKPSINPSYSASPSHPTRSQSRYKTSSLPKQQQPTYSSQFDAHVDDLRKSLETIEANPFSSKQKNNKSKMKRSVSEQSLHTIQWDQDRSDIDDLVNAYTTGGQGMSHFDLHTFGNEEAF